MIRSLRFACALGVVTAAALSACSSKDSNSGGSGAFSTGLPKDELLGSLSDADTKKLCDAFASYESSVVLNGSGCKFVGIAAAALSQISGPKTDAELQKACSDAQSACEKAPPTTMDAGTSTSTCTKPPASCTATVGELETCVMDEKAATDTAFASIPECSTLTAQALQPRDGGTSSMATPMSCTTGKQKCPVGPFP